MKKYSFNRDKPLNPWQRRGELVSRFWTQVIIDPEKAFELYFRQMIEAINDVEGERVEPAETLCILEEACEDLSDPDNGNMGVSPLIYNPFILLGPERVAALMEYGFERIKPADSHGNPGTWQ